MICYIYIRKALSFLPLLIFQFFQKDDCIFIFVLIYIVTNYFQHGVNYYFNDINVHVIFAFTQTIKSFQIVYSNNLYILSQQFLYSEISNKKAIFCSYKISKHIITYWLSRIYFVEMLYKTIRYFISIITRYN